MSSPENTIPEIYIPYEEDYEETPQLLPDDDNTVDSDSTTEFEKPININLIHA